MALLCKRCHADVTDDMALAKPKTEFVCKCGSNEFRHYVDDPKVEYRLTPNDRRFLRRLYINGSK